MDRGLKLWLSVALVAVQLSPLIAVAATTYPTAPASNEITPPKVLTRTPTGVNISDGSFVYSSLDLKAGSLELRRIHKGGQSSPAPPGSNPFGTLTTHSFESFVYPYLKGDFPAPCPHCFLTRRYKPIVYLGGSASGRYHQDISPNPGIYRSNEESESGVLKRPSGSYRYVDQNGTVFSFSSAHRLTSSQYDITQKIIQASYGNGLQHYYGYDAQDRLVFVSSNDGFAIAFEYNSSNLVQSACAYNLSTTYAYPGIGCAGAQNRTSYEYTNGQLTKFTDAAGGQTLFGYTGGQISCITPPGAVGCQISNTYASGTGRVTSQTLIDGSIWSFQYNGIGVSNVRNSSYYLWEEPYNSTTITDPANNVSIASFNKSSPYSYTDALGRTTQYRYRGGYDSEEEFIQSQSEDGSANYTSDMHEGSLLVSVISPEGNRYDASYTGPFLSLRSKTNTEKSGNQSTKLTIEYGFATACEAAAQPALDPPGEPTGDCPKPIWMRDAKGKQTDYSYAPHGGILSEMRPADVAGGARPLNLTTWAQRYSWIKNSAGSLVQSSNPIWVISTETECQTVAGSNAISCDTSAPQRTVTYNYGASGSGSSLLLVSKSVSSSGVTLTSCFQYDQWSNKIGETSPNGTQGGCP